MDVLDLSDKRHSVISVKPLEPTAKVPFPTPTTYDAIVRYHLEICSPVSRQFVATLASFAPDDETKAEMTKLGGDKGYFHEKVSVHHLNIADVLRKVSKGKKWTNVPFSVLIESVTKLQPRYYSISSSSLVQPKKISITAVVEVQDLPGRDEPFRGVATNYLLALKQKQNGDPNPTPFGATYEIMGPRNKYDGIHVPVHVRHSNFKLPSDPSKPVILIGPGTGVAPFRAFVQERAQQAKNGEDVGKTILFFGCRRRGEDFIYEKEWDVSSTSTSPPTGHEFTDGSTQEYKKTLGDKFELVTAFSREGAKKVYVQHRLRERGKEINELLEKKAYFYVCGDAANMAREVNAVLAQILTENRGITEQKAEEIVKNMRAANQYQVSPHCHFLHCHVLVHEPTLTSNLQEDVWS
jgi:NADPH-ferrihemoprotein reductase